MPVKSESGFSATEYIGIKSIGGRGREGEPGSDKGCAREPSQRSSRLDLLTTAYYRSQQRLERVEAHPIREQHVGEVDRLVEVAKAGCKPFVAGLCTKARFLLGDRVLLAFNVSGKRQL